MYLIIIYRNREIIKNQLNTGKIFEIHFYRLKAKSATL